MPVNEAVERSEFAPQSFVIKIWLEEAAAEGTRATWRGHITHVPSGQRRYIQDLEGISAFVAPYLRQMGVNNDLRL
jgi:hypothetical protein